MGRLKSDNLATCLSLLQEFISRAEVDGGKKKKAILALEQLRRITAGTDNPEFPVKTEDQFISVDVDSVCTGRPRAYTSPIYVDPEV